MYRITQTQNFKFDLFDLVIFDGHDLTQVYRILRMVPRSISDTMHGIPSALFKFATVAMSGEASNDG